MSDFDDIFANAANTFHDVFGDTALYRFKSDNSAIDLQFNRISLTKNDRTDETGSNDCWTLIGTVLKSDVDEPAKGDELEYDGRTFKVSQTPTTAEDGSQWEIELLHEKPTRRGGGRQIPIY